MRLFMSGMPPMSQNPTGGSSGASGPNQSSQTQQSQGPSQAQSKDQKPFRKDEKSKNKGDKSEGQANAEGNVQGEMKQMITEGRKGDVQGSFKTEGVQQKMQMDKVHEVILRGVDAMRVSETGKVEVDLKTTPNIPEAFQGGTLSLSTEGTTTVIRFDNIDVASAQTLMDNDSAKAELARVLSSKNINEARVELGNNVTLNINRPEGQQIQGTQETMTGQQDYLQQERGGGGGGGGGQGGGEGEGGPQE